MERRAGPSGGQSRFSGVSLMIKSLRSHLTHHQALYHFLRIALRALAATLILWVAVSLPLPMITSQLFLTVRLPIAIFLFIAYIGKLLFDTFFFDRYR